ncbi:glycoside hydrolase [[Mycobacterium] wendilense]|uniref:Glycoside hydrolase n=2 Tax=[Mycobacterium] wendilense TaxID=3064284 RepID=A0ABN9P7X1_9MYCO|nr:glycoside hydrolase [Mycolicibacterium sp. MU0050]
MGRNLLASHRGRLFVLAVSVALSGGMLYAQGTAPVQRVAEPTAAAAAAGPVGPAPDAPRIATPAEADLLAASSPVAAARDFQFELPAGVAPESGLQVKTIWVARAISVMFPEITTIGGYRQDPLKWHPNGLAIDVMIPNHNSDKGIELGNQIAGLALANAERWGVLHVIWRQGYYPGIGAPSWTADYGSETLNHYDHVHIATDGGGYPSGDETYFLASMDPAPKS